MKPRGLKPAREEQAERRDASLKAGSTSEKKRADVAQLVEHSLGKGEVIGSIPIISSRV